MFFHYPGMKDAEDLREELEAEFQKIVVTTEDVHDLRALVAEVLLVAVLEVLGFPVLEVH